MPVNILFIGDIIGKPGRQALSWELHRLVDRHGVDIVIANGENAAAGFGITEDIARELYDMGVHVITSGNHIWDKRDAYSYIDREERLLRPANYPEGAPGRGCGLFSTPGGIKVGVLNLEGRVFMNNLECPFRTGDREIARLREKTHIILVDFHAEATSEKAALACHMDGRVSVFVGTHTHVQTADERILPGGTAFITDAGMTGGFDSVIGMKKEQVIGKFLTLLPARFEVEKRDTRLNGVLARVDEHTGKALAIERINVRCSD